MAPDNNLAQAINLFGVKMHPWSMRQTVTEIDRRIGTGIFIQHVVVNAAKIVKMQDDLALRSAVTGCDIVNIDGAGVVLAARLLGHRVPERVAGIDLFAELLRLAEKTQRRVYFLGAKPDVIEQAVAKIRNAHPDLPVAGYHHGYFWDDEKATVERIRASRADLLFVGISSPMKEKFIDKWSNELGVKFAMGVGGTFDIYAGLVRRAPIWMQEHGLEWLYRVYQEPRRMFMRYLTTNSRFLVLIAKAWVQRFSRNGNAKAKSESGE